MRKIILLTALLLTACYSTSSTNSTIAHVPVKTCSVSSFSCTVIQDSNNDIGLSLRNNLGFDVSAVAVTLNTVDCVLQQKTISVGRIPKDADSPAHFTCTSVVPDTFTGKITLVYTVNGATKTVTGSVSMKD